MLMILVQIINAILLIAGAGMLIGFVIVIIIEWKNKDILIKRRK